MAAVRPYKLFSNFPLHPLHSSIKLREKLFCRMLPKRYQSSDEILEAITPPFLQGPKIPSFYILMTS